MNTFRRAFFSELGRQAAEAYRFGNQQLADKITELAVSAANELFRKEEEQLTRLERKVDFISRRAKS